MTFCRTKAAKMYKGYFENINFQVETAVGTFFIKLGKIGLLFITASGHTDYRRSLI